MRTRDEIGGESGSLEVVDECTEFDRRPDGGGGGDPDPDPDPGPPPVVEGQVADQLAEALPAP